MSKYISICSGAPTPGATCLYLPSPTRWSTQDKDIQRALSYWEKQDLIHIKATPGGVIHSITFSDLPSASDEPEMRSASFSGASTADTRQASGSYLNNSRSAGAETAVSGAAFYQSENSRIPRTETSGTSVKDSLEAAASTSAHPGDGPGNAASANKSSAPSRDRIAALADQKDVRQIFTSQEQYLKRPLTCAEQEDFVYYYDTLKFSSDLIIYLLEYCISKGSFSRHYMRKVALRLGRIRYHHGCAGQTGVKSLQQKLFYDPEYVRHQGPQSGRS